MCKNLPLYLLINLLTNANQKSNHPPLTQLKNARIINININYVQQNGNANIAGNGSSCYTKLGRETKRLEMLEKENKILTDLLEALKLRDK